MKLAGEKPKDKVALLASMLPIGKDVIIELGKLPPNRTTLEKVYLSSQKSIKDGGGNIPEKKDGKTPAIVTLELFDGNSREYIDLELDAIDYSLGIGKWVLCFKWGQIVIKEL